VRVFVHCRGNDGFGSCDDPSETVTLQAGALTGFESAGLLTLAARLPQMSA
jgi:hypothetical protein